MLFHIGPLMGRDQRYASGAFQRVVQLNPRLVPAWDHLVQTAMLLEDTTLFVRSWARLNSLLPPDPGGYPPVRIVLPLHLHLLRGGSFDGPLAESFVDHAVEQAVQNHAWLALWLSANAQPAAQIDLSRRVLARSPEPEVGAIHRKAIALAWAARGDWESALAAMDAYASRASELAQLSEEQIGGIAASPDLARLDPYRLAVIGAWLGALDPGLAAARRQVAADAVARMASAWRQAEMIWLDGLLAVSKRDLNGLHEAQGRLKRVDSTSSRVPLRSLTAFELELLGRRREAADSMAAVSWEWNSFVGPYSLGISRMAAARWSAAERDLDKATSLLPWHKSVIISVSFIQGAVVLDGLSILEMGRVEDARGNPHRAQEYYQRFVQRYDSPSPRVRHLVDEAQVALRRLE
jgi:tetratricopeptide (TPR) repeat protein